MARRLRARLESTERELERLKQAPHRAETLWRLLQAVPDIVYCASLPEFRITFISAAVTTRLGFSPEAFLADAGLWLQQIHPADRPRVLNGRCSALERGADYCFEYRLQHRDGGSLRWFEDRGNLETGPAGSAVAVTGVLRDITEHRWAQQQAKRQRPRPNGSLERLIEIMGKAVEARDRYTAGHQRRVADLATAISRRLGLSAEETDGVRMASLLHDVGKIHIPAEILNKPGRLREAEHDLLRTHPDAGYEILRTVDFQQPVAQIVWQHHERVDGSGYPQGLGAEHILPQAQILAVADVVETMASHRPYRPALGLERALSEIASQRGVRYGTHAVDVCLAVFAQEGFRFGTPAGDIPWHGPPP